MKRRGTAEMNTNIKVTCPHCGKQTWVRDGWNDPCQYCGKIVQTR